MAQIGQPQWIEDTPTRCLVAFAHRGPIENHSHDLGLFMSPSNSWWIPVLKVSEGTRPLNSGGDFVNIAGSAMQHITQPPGPEHAADAPNGHVADFAGPAMNAAAFPNGGIMRRALDVVHDIGHVDRYELTLMITVQGPKITGYRIGFSAEHVVVEVKKLPKVDDRMQAPVARRRPRRAV